MAMSMPLPRARLQRRASSDMGTFGCLLAPGYACFTGELPERGNAPGVSCIPPGDYLATWALSPRLKRYTYRLSAVPQRSGVLLHPANLMGDKTKGFVAQLEGCIAPGEKLGAINGQAAVLVSRPALRRFEAAMNRQPFILEVRNA